MAKVLTLLALPSDVLTHLCASSLIPTSLVSAPASEWAAVVSFAAASSACLSARIHPEMEPTAKLGGGAQEVEVEDVEDS